ncbi:CHASE2 domain-containing protein [Halanaerobaculum tunisiense]
MLQNNSWLLVGSLIAILVTIIFISGILQDIELVTYDYRLLIKSLFTVNKQSDIVIVKIDQKSLTELGAWPWSREYHAQLIKKLNQAGAEVIGFDVLFDLATTPQADNRLANELSRWDNILLPSTVELKMIKSWQEKKIKVNQVNPPLDKFNQQALKGGYLNLVPDQDGKIRRVTLLEEEGLTPFALKLARRYSQQEKKIINKEGLINFHYQSNYFTKISYSEVLTADFPEGFFQDKLVLIGATDSSLQDYLMTPLAMVKGYLPGVRIQAEIIDSYLQDSFLYNLNNLKTIGLILLYSLGLAYIYHRIALGPGLIVTGLQLSVMIAINLWLLVAFNLVIPIIPIILITILNLISSNLISYWEIADKKKRLKTVFSRYLAPRVVEEVIDLADEDYLQGQRREISVLFIDLVGFTTFSEDQEAREVVNLLNQYFSLVTEETFQLAGTLDKFLGDGAMIFFGAPVKQTDHAQKAVHLALELRTKINQDSDIPLAITVGINTGRAIVGNIGSIKRSDYTAIGDVVNTAARIETEAQSNEILIGEKTAQQINDEFLVKLKQVVQLPGQEKKTKLYCIQEE